MDERELISVVIPTYNHAHFLKSALQSVVDQTYTNWEVIVVNNYSNDNTIDVVNGFDDSRIKLFNFKNHGIIAAGRNKGIAESSGQYIAFLDSDDIWYVDKLKQCIDKLKEGFDLVCHGEYWIKDNGYKRAVKYGPKKRARYRSLLLDGNCISTSATVVRKKYIDKVDGFCESPEIITAEDYDLWLKLSRSNARIEFIQKILGEYRIHDMNNSKVVMTNMYAEKTVVENHLSMLGKLSPLFSLQVRRRRGLVFYGAGRGFHSNQDFRKALSYYFKSWLIYPLNLRLYPASFLSIINGIKSYRKIRREKIR
jgi:glycosyltransferase involved in cell wall biosynthesis